MTDNPELLPIQPCRFCNGTQYYITSNRHGNYAIQCINCYASGSRKSSRTEAIKSWNTHPPALVKIEEEEVLEIILKTNITPEGEKHFRDGNPGYISIKDMRIIAKALVARFGQAQGLVPLENISDLIFLKLLDFFPNQNRELLTEMALSLDKSIRSKFGQQRQEPKLCKCPQEPAKTVRKINDDFWGCPKCGGLIVRQGQKIVVEWPKKKYISKGFSSENFKFKDIDKMSKESIYNLGRFDAWNEAIEACKQAYNKAIVGTEKGEEK